MAPIYRERQHVLRTELEDCFGDDCEILGGQAGLHLVLRLPENRPDTVLAEAASRQGVVARALSSYYADARSGNGLVLGYGMAEAGQIPELVRRLALSVRS
jgi:GntR family transcriptional regulator/MocR family aminotransferase